MPYLSKPVQSFGLLYGLYGQRKRIYVSQSQISGPQFSFKDSLIYCLVTCFLPCPLLINNGESHYLIEDWWIMPLGKWLQTHTNLFQIPFVSYS